MSLTFPGPSDSRELRQEQRLRVAMRSGWPEIPRSHLRSGRNGQVVDETDGRFYRLYRGEVDSEFCAAVAFFVDESGRAIFLEPPAGGPRTVDELEAQRAAREQRRAARAKAVPAWRR